MNSIVYIFLNIFYTITRLLPFPCKTGIIRIGNPDRKSPVFVTCNYHLTVMRLKKELSGQNAYLLVANSRGINVWCAACGGHFTNHDIISILKVSGIGDLVDHRTIILPQLAAPGIEPKVIKEKTGWRGIWGPVYAKDIQGFTESNLKKTDEMRRVKFPLVDRFEMAVAWAFPVSFFSTIIFLPLWRTAVLPMIGIIWAISLLIFLPFPLYEERLRNEGKSVGFIIFDFGSGGLQMILWGLFVLGLFGYEILTGDFSWAFIFRWGLASLVVILIISLDLTGSTPVFKSSLHEENLLKVSLDEDKCKGTGICIDVCPKNCFTLDKKRRKAEMTREAECEKCAACIVQCPFDALSFKGDDGVTINPEATRKYKLNLMGKRSVAG